MKRVVVSAALVALIACRSVPQHYAPVHAADGAYVWSLLVDIELVARGVPIARDSVRRLTITYVPQRDGVATMYTNNLRVRRLTPEQIGRVVALIEAAGVLGAHDSPQMPFIDGAAWRIHTRLNDNIGLRVIVSGEDLPLIGQLLEVIR